MKKFDTSRFISYCAAASKSGTTAFGIFFFIWVRWKPLQAWYWFAKYTTLSRPIVFSSPKKTEYYFVINNTLFFTSRFAFIHRATPNLPRASAVTATPQSNRRRNRNVMKKKVDSPSRPMPRRRSNGFRCGNSLTRTDCDDHDSAFFCTQKQHGQNTQPWPFAFSILYR